MNEMMKECQKAVFWEVYWKTRTLNYNENGDLVQGSARWFLETDCEWETG